MTQRMMVGLLLLAASGTMAPVAALTLSSPEAPVAALTLSSPDVRDGGTVATAQLYKDCGGGNVSPALAWSGAPAGTKSFAVTVFDPDAPGGSGWWHWIVTDLPPATNGLPRAVTSLPAGARAGTNDYGDTHYDGACPPPGSGIHHYRFTVWALPVSRLPFEGARKGAAIGPYLTAHALAKATLTATYGR